MRAVRGPQSLLATSVSSWTFLKSSWRAAAVKWTLLSLRCAGVSNQLQLFVKEQERNKLLCSADPQLSSTPPSTSDSANAKTPASRRKQKAGKRGRTKDLEEDPLMETVEAADEHLDEGEKSGRKSRAKQNTAGIGNTEESPAENTDTQPAAGEHRYPFHMQTLIFNNLHLLFFYHSDEIPDCSKYTPPAPHSAGNNVINTCRTALSIF